MTLWGVDKCYWEDNKPHYVVLPYNFRGTLISCWKWFGLRGLKNKYLSKRYAEKVANKRNGVRVW